MNRQSEIDHSTLGWVKKELDETLRHSAEALERFAEDPEDRTQLQFCVTHLHQVYGILQMLELSGAAMLTEEMEQLGWALLDGSTGGQEVAAEVLMRAIIRLRDYLERVETGQRDAAILILPLVNEMRAARGERIVTESAMFAPDIEQQPAPRRERDGDRLAQVIGKARTRYQHGLLTYLRGQGADKGLRLMGRCLDELDAASPDERSALPWWAALGLVDALAAGQLREHVAAVRSMLGQVERYMKQVRKEGAAAGTPTALLRGLLYYVALAEPVTERVAEIQRQFDLATLLAEQEALEQAREGVFGPGAEALQGIADLLREDLAGVKDTLDLYVRGSVQDPERLTAAGNALRRVADTLGMVGLAGPRRTVQEQIELLEQLAADGNADEAQLMRSAEALLYVESALDGLVGEGRIVAEQDTEESDGDPDPGAQLFENEYRGVYGTVIGEALFEVGQVKEGIIRLLENHDPSELQGLGERFEAIRGALDVMELSRASALVSSAGRYLDQGFGSTQAMPRPEVLDDLADAIASIEYYLEALRDGRGQAEQILDVAENSLGRLGFGPAPSDGSPAISVVPAPGDPAGDAGVEAGPPDPSAADPSGRSRDASIDFSRKRGRVDLDVPVHAEEMDPEILEVFIEEAEEVLGTLGEVYPRWRANPEDQDALLTTRRMFHTLKGSGRLAGALLLGELAWSVENLLNRILDHTLEPGPEIHATVGAAIDAVPGLVAELQGEPAPDVDVRALMRRAQALANPGPGDDPNPAGGGGRGPTGGGGSPGGGSGSDSAGPSETGGPPPGRAGQDPEEGGHRWEIEMPPETGGDASAGAGTGPPDRADGDAGMDGLWSLPDPDASVAAQASSEREPEPVDPPLASPDMPGFPEARDETDGPGETAGPGDPPVASTGPAMEPALYEIFSKETGDHLATVRRFLEGRRSPDSGVYRVDEGLIRSLHTLTGSARMADVEPIARLGRHLEQMARCRYGEAQPLDEADRDLLQRAADRIDAVVGALGRGDAESPGVEELVQEIDARCGSRAAPSLEVRALSEPEQDSPVIAEDSLARVSEHLPQAGGEPLPDSDPVPAEPATDEAMVEAMVEEARYETASAESLDPDLTGVFREEAEDILRVLETTLERWEQEPESEGHVAELHRSLHTVKGGARLAGFSGIGRFCHALESLVEDVGAHRVPADDTFFELLHACLDRLGDLLEQMREGRTPEAPEELLQKVEELRGGRAVPQPEETGSDQELVGVFLEEATEILTGAETMIHEWRQAPEDENRFVTELQRSLHTLKGGARMAGFGPMADLSHALETLLKAIGEGEQAVSDTVFDLLEQANDRLIGLREAAEAKRPAAGVEDLLERIGRIRHGEPDPGNAAAGSGSAAAPEPATQVDAAPDAPEPAGSATGATEPRPTEPEPRRQGDVVRVRSDLLDNLVNYAGEVSIYRARLEQQSGAVGFNLGELDQTVSRLREQLRTLEIETEAQILYRFEREHDRPAHYDEDFDPLEMDRFSRIQELSRALSESVNDLLSIQGTLSGLNRETETLLLQQSRVNTDLQDGLMRTRMVPFANLAPRMRRIVRQACQDLDKDARLKIVGAQGEMDRTVLERVIPPLEHMLRNAVAHGIEAPEERRKLGKPESGTISVSLYREGADVVIRVEDDGGGMSLEAIRRKAVAQGLMAEGAPLTDKEIMQFVLESGFSTAERVTQVAGRGVGMDVVNAEIKQLGGSLEIDSQAGRGTRFTIRLPFTLALNQALLCHAGEEVYAIPLSAIEGVTRVDPGELAQLYHDPAEAIYDYAGTSYSLRSLAVMLGAGEPQVPDVRRVPLVLVHAGDHRLALQVDGLLGSRDIVVKSVGPQISSVPGIFGATILADGRVVLILDVSTLVRFGVSADTGGEEPAGEGEEPVRTRPMVMVVDDSITMRKVATRLLERNDMDVITAKDGVDAVAALQESRPDAMLLDIEMPRMDGYELATHMRNDERLREIPIIMVTSRTGEKHRQRAMDIGVDRYLGKPYQESDLLVTLQELLEQRHVTA